MQLVTSTHHFVPVNRPPAAPESAPDAIAPTGWPPLLVPHAVRLQIVICNIILPPPRQLQSLFSLSRWPLPSFLWCLFFDLFVDAGVFPSFASPILLNNRILYPFTPGWTWVPLPLILGPDHSHNINIMAKSALFTLFTLLWASHLSSALQVTPNSPCSSVCRDSLDLDVSDPNSSNTRNSDITCHDSAYSSAAGTKFKNCMTCLEKSTFSQGSESDTMWFLCASSGSGPQAYPLTP